MNDFSKRLLDAISGHPDAPEKRFGRQKWLLDQLASKSGLHVTPNTVHKWFKGTSKPRHDHLRALAHALSVDEAWLVLGVKPLVDGPTRKAMERHISSSGAILSEAFQLTGWQAGVPQANDQPYNLVVIGAAGIVEIELLSEVMEGPESLYYVNEPVGARKLIELRLKPNEVDEIGVMQFTLRDFSNVPRRKFGGYSLISGRFQDDGRFLPRDGEAPLCVSTSLDCIAGGE